VNHLIAMQRALSAALAIGFCCWAGNLCLQPRRLFRPVRRLMDAVPPCFKGLMPPAE